MWTIVGDGSRNVSFGDPPKTLLERRWATGALEQLGRGSEMAAKRVIPIRNDCRITKFDTNTFRGWAGGERCSSQNGHTENRANVGITGDRLDNNDEGPTSSRDMSPERCVKRSKAIATCKQAYRQQ